MKKLIFSIIAVMSLTTAIAQDNDRPRRDGQRNFDRTEMLKRRTDDVVKKYNLNSEQAEKLLALNTKFADKLNPRMGGFGRGRGSRPAPNFGGGNGGNRPEMTEEQRAQFEQMRKQREENQKAYEAELEKILTPDQFKSYQEDMKQQREQRGRGMGGRRGGGGPGFGGRN